MKDFWHDPLFLVGLISSKEGGAASGNIVSFDAPRAAPLRSLRIGIDPVQAGTGDPSPDNVRPISGWSAVDLWRTGKNLLEITMTDGTVNGTTFTKNTDGSITISGTPSAQARRTIHSGKFWGPGFGTGLITVGVPSNVRVFCKKVLNGTTSYPTLSPSSYLLDDGSELSDLLIEVNTPFDGTETTIYPQIELGSATPYAPYTGTTYPITIPTPPGTVFGGYIQVAEDGSAELVVTHEVANLGQKTWYQHATYANVFYCSVSDAVAGVQGESQVRCSEYKPIGSTTTQLMSSNEKCVAMQTGYKTVLVCNSDYSSASDIKTAMSGVQLVYELATPLTYPLSDITVQTLAGENVMWADCGDISVEWAGAKSDLPMLVWLMNRDRRNAK